MSETEYPFVADAPPLDEEKTSEPEKAVPEPGPTVPDVADSTGPSASASPEPFIPTQGVPAWLSDAIHELHVRLTGLGG